MASGRDAQEADHLPDPGQLTPLDTMQGIRPVRCVTLRAIAIACTLMPLLAVWVVQAELIWYTGHSTAISLFFHVTFVVFLLSVLNLGWRKLVPRGGLSSGELLTIYVMLSIGGGLSAVTTCCRSSCRC